MVVAELIAGDFEDSLLNQAQTIFQGSCFTLRRRQPTLEVTAMSFESVSPSAVRSVKQQDFIKVWFRIFEKTGRLPALAAFQPSRLENEQPELMYYDVIHADNDIRYPVTFAGSRLIEAYGFSAVGRDLQDIIS